MYNSCIFMESINSLHIFIVLHPCILMAYQMSRLPLRQSDGPSVIPSPWQGELCTHEAKEGQEASAKRVLAHSSPTIKLDN